MSTYMTLPLVLLSVLHCCSAKEVASKSTFVDHDGKEHTRNSVGSRGRMDTGTLPACKETDGETKVSEDCKCGTIDSVCEKDSTCFYDGASSKCQKGNISSACFPLDALVKTPQGVVPMSALRAGDLVLTGAGFEEVHGVLHRSDAEAQFVELRVGSKRIRASGEHLLFLANGRGVHVRDVAVGDMLLVGRVDGVGHAKSAGFAAPLTPSGTIMVDGVMASVYAGAPGSHAAFHAALRPISALREALLTGELGIAPPVPAVLRQMSA